MTLGEMIRLQSATRPDAIYLSRPGSPSITFEDLSHLLDIWSGVLALQNCSSQNRIGVVASDCVRMAACLLAIGAIATAMPLHINLPRAEYGRLFQAADLKLLVSDIEPAISAAQELAIPVISPDTREPMGSFTPGPLHDAFLFSSSGSTGDAKLITRADHHFVDANNVLAQHYGVRPDDLILNPLPLTHTYTQATIGRALSAGCQCIPCSPFVPAEFASLIRALRPTLLFLPPAVLQATLDAMQGQPLQNSRLRYIGSGGSRLPLPLLNELERYFGVCVLEGYGATEVSVISVSPVPPARRKPGSVGVPIVPIRFEDGEIVVKPDPSPHTPWYYTGDLGHLDEDGFLYLTGRNKEMIKRGGQRIAPREIEEVLGSHQGVSEVVCYSIPHKELGEEVAATVVLRDSRLTREELTSFASQRLSFAKMPKQMAFRGRLELGPTGKPLRIDVVPPRLLELWSEALGCEVESDDDFFEFGGTSLSAALLMSGIEKEFGFSPSLDSLLLAPSPRKQAQLLREGGESGILPLRPGGSKPPLFFLCPHTEGSLFWRTVADLLPEDQPCYTVYPKIPDSVNRASAADVVQDFIRKICKVTGKGPCSLAGYSLGGRLAFEAACGLQADGLCVEKLILLDSHYFPTLAEERTPVTPIIQKKLLRWLQVLARLPYYWNAIRHQGLVGIFTKLEMALARFRRPPLQPHATPAKDSNPIQQSLRRLTLLVRQLTPNRFDGRALLIRARYQQDGFSDTREGWSEVVSELAITTIDSTHLSLVSAPWIGKASKALAHELTLCRNTMQSNS